MENDKKRVAENAQDHQEVRADASEKPRKKKKFFSAKRLSAMAVFCALSFVVSLFDFPVFPATPFLKLDFGNVFIMLAGFLFGPIEGVFICVVKELLHFALFSQTGGVGELANVLITSSYLLLPATAYRYKKGIVVVAITLFFACFIQSGTALLANRAFLFSAYGIKNVSAVFSSVWGYIFAFNLLKGGSVSVLTILLYKRLSKLLKKWEV